MGIIKRQSIYFTLISYIGLGIGAINTLLLMPHYLSHEQVGLISVFTAIAFPMAAIANLGSNFAINRFLPYYKKLLQAKDNDLPILAVTVSLFGFSVLLLLVWFIRPYIFDWFSHAPLLVDYFYLIPFFALGYMLCSIFQNLNNGYLYNTWVSLVTEVIFRTFNLLLILVLIANWMDFNEYIHFYVFMFWLGLILYVGKLKSTGTWYFFTRISELTKKIKGFMIPYSSFFWFTSVFSVLATMIDSLVLAGVSGLEKSGSLMIASYIITVTQIPQRSMVSVSVPVIAESWRKKDMSNLAKIYGKSANNMLWAGGGIYLCILFSMNEILSFLPKEYHEIKWVVLVLGIAKLIDYGTGVNQNILALSRKNWKVDFYTNIILVLSLVPLNYFLIKSMGILGAAFANLIGYFIYNFIRTIYLYKSTNLTPFSKENARMAGIIFGFLIVEFFYLYLTPVRDFSIIQNIAIIGVKSLVFLFVYGYSILFLRASEDVNVLLKIHPYLEKLFFLKKL